MACSRSAGIQPPTFFVANGLLSAISDNVFVATVYINEVASTRGGVIDRNSSTRWPSRSTRARTYPASRRRSGCILFLLTGAAPLIRLSYVRMVVMALPYTVTMTVTGLLAVAYLI
jgi:NhaB family Na+:H+ antiporter